MSIAAQLPTRVLFRVLFGIETATPLQLGLCRVLDGEPLRRPDQIEAVTRACGGALPTERPKEFYLLAAIRSGKSRLAAAVALRASQTVDVSSCLPGEIARYSIVSTSTDNANAIYQHLLGTVLSQPLLRPLRVRDNARTLTLRHPSGKLVEVHVAAGARAGSTLIARWSLGVTFDEAPRMGGESDGVVNLAHSASSVRGRLLPGAQILYVGSPWAPFGPVYDAVQTFYGLPKDGALVARATGPELNPVLWTPEACEALRKVDADAYASDVLGEFRQPETGLFGSELDAAIRVSRETLPPDAHHFYVAAIDPATRGNAWTLVVLTRERDKRVVVLTKEWRGSKGAPINPTTVFQDIAALLRPYRVAEVSTDQWSYDALRDIAGQHGLYLRQRPMTQAETSDGWTSFRNAMIAGNVEVAGAGLVSDLRRIVRRITQTSFVIHLPETTDGRHCDFAPALLRAWLTYCQPAYEQRSAAEVEAERIAKLRKQLATPPPGGPTIPGEPRRSSPLARH